MSYTIEYLANHPEHLDTVAQWYWDEWDRHEGWNIERSRQFARQGMNKDKLDMVLVALNEEKDCVGTIQVRKEWGLGNETPDFLKKYSPWLGSLFVRKEDRCNNVAPKLCRQLLSELMTLKIQNCYAATSHLDSFFMAHNGKNIGDVHFAGEDMRIYEFNVGEE